MPYVMCYFRALQKGVEIFVPAFGCLQSRKAQCHYFARLYGGIRKWKMDERRCCHRRQSLSLRHGLWYWKHASNLLAIPIVASNCLGEDEVRLFAKDTLLLTRIHQLLEIVCFGVFIGSVSARVSKKASQSAAAGDQRSMNLAHVSNICRAGSSVSSCSVIKYRGV